MTERRKQGELLDIALQLGDGASQTTLVRVFVDIKDSDKVLLEPRFEIFDDADGLYEERTRTMPSDRHIYVIYTITDTGGSNLTPLYSPAVFTEEYLRDLTGELVESGLTASAGGQDNIEGVASASEPIIADLTDVSLLGELSDDTMIEGEIKDEC